MPGSSNMIFHAGMPMPLDEALAFRDAVLDVGVALENGARVFDAIVALLNEEDLLKPLELEAFIRLQGRGLRAVSETSGGTLSTLYDRLVHSVDELKELMQETATHERQRAEALAKGEADAA